MLKSPFTLCTLQARRGNVAGFVHIRGYSLRLAELLHDIPAAPCGSMPCLTAARVAIPHRAKSVLSSCAVLRASVLSPTQLLVIRYRLSPPENAFVRAKSIKTSLNELTESTASINRLIF